MKSYDKKDNSLKEKYPSSNCDKVNSFIEEKNFPKDFYPCFQVSIQLYDVNTTKIFYLLRKNMILIWKNWINSYKIQ